MGSIDLSMMLRKKRQLIIFLLIWPAINLLLTAIALFALNAHDINVLIDSGSRLWLVFTLAFILLSVLEQFFAKVFIKGTFWAKLVIHILVIFSVFAMFAPIVILPESLLLPRVAILPFAILTMQIIIYVAMMHIYSQQEFTYETRLNLQEAELNVLRAQSNPHFLFNTLNLIATEIAENPVNAEEIVYDLADLLRFNFTMANQKFARLADELNLVKLYLTLQQKRFAERLTFEIQMNPVTKDLQVPALILLPVIENTIKHAVAPFTSNAKINVKSYLEAEQLVIKVQDSGSAFDDKILKDGEGFRILRKTLQLHFPNQHEISLKSTESGGVFMMAFPAMPYAQDTGKTR